jgi:NADH-quinone oxidoreductase subunit H
MQRRSGPNRVGPWGLMQPMADAIKFVFKEENVPAKAHKVLFLLAPALAVIPPLISFTVIPLAGSINLEGIEFPVQVANMSVGLLFLLAINSMHVFSVLTAGWASNNKFSLMGSVRAASQMVSYEVAMGLSIIALIMMTGTLSLKEISVQQAGMNWNVFYQPVGFLIFLICAFAETNRTPFDLAECESELIGGYHTEYSSMKMGFYLFAEYANMFISSTILAVLYFGGYNYPGMQWMVDHVGVNMANILGIGVLFIKICCFIFFFMWIRWTIPRFRYDQLMNLGWKILIPLSIANIIITGICILAFN